MVQTVKSKRKILFLINPKSGVGSKNRLPGMIEKFIDSGKYDYSIAYTQYAGHACELAVEAAANKVDVVVAVGGDGTINEVARSIVHTDTALGVVPCGSGNGFARHLGVPMSLRKALEFINRAEPVVIDYGKINDKPFFCACGVGFDALVSNDFAKGGRRGMMSYVQKTLVDWVTYKPEEYEVEIDSVKRTFKAFVIACGNASQYGNNAYIAPFASMRDGMLSVSVLAPFTTLNVPILAAQLFNNTLDKNRHMTTFAARKVKIKRKAAGAVHYDGEPSVMEAELNIEIVPDGLRVLALPGWDGTCRPVPILRQVYDIVSGVLPTLPVLGRK